MKNKPGHAAVPVARPAAMASFNFMSHRRPAALVSLVAVVGSLLSLIFQGLNLGLDFTGGVILEVAYEQPAELAGIRSLLAEAGFPEAQVQNLGGARDVLIRLAPEAIGVVGEEADVVIEALRRQDPAVVLRRNETVGPQIGDELTEQGGLAMLFALVGIFIYIMFRFRWKFAAGAMVATLHDAIVTIGVFSLLGWEFNLTVLGAVLAVIGYSVNDTIVVFDRIRDNFRLMRRMPAAIIANESINQTLSRTLITGGTTMLVLLSLLFLGGEFLWGFAMALIVGLIVGTYSSIYVASAVALALDVSSEDFALAAANRTDDLP